MTRWILFLSFCLAAASCKGETVYKDDPNTLQALRDCETQVSRKDNHIKELEGRLGDIKMAQSSDEIIVTITGDTMTISGKDGKPRPTGDKAPKKEHIEAFIAQVQKSRGSMQRCYQNALKKDSGLQMRTQTMNIQVRFTATGKVSRATFAPSISQSFTQCMSAIAQKWKVPGAPTGAMFQQPITLSPQ